MTARSEPRPIQEIFSDLCRLVQSDGALHEISAIVYRDWGVTVDTQAGRVVCELGYRWARKKLNNNEILLLLGLCV